MKTMMMSNFSIGLPGIAARSQKLVAQQSVGNSSPGRMSRRWPRQSGGVSTDDDQGRILGRGEGNAESEAAQAGTIMIGRFAFLTLGPRPFSTEPAPLLTGAGQILRITVWLRKPQSSPHRPFPPAPLPYFPAFLDSQLQNPKNPKNPNFPESPFLHFPISPFPIPHFPFPHFSVPPCPGRTRNDAGSEGFHRELLHDRHVIDRHANFCMELFLSAGMSPWNGSTGRMCGCP